MARIVCIVFLGVILLAPLAAQSKDYDMESDLVIGYNYVFGADDDYYRNHNDATTGFLVDSYRFSLSPKDDAHWFDKLTVDMSLANRIDYGKGVEVRFLKQGKYSARLKYTFYYDYFNDPEYNYGDNRRNLGRDNFQFNFDWKSVKDFVFSFGYQQNRSRNEFNYPGFYWGDSFAIPLHLNNTYQEVKGGVAYNHAGFTAGFTQAWIWFTDQSRYPVVDMEPGAGIGGLPVAMDNPQRTGKVESTIPQSTVTAGYKADIWSVNFAYEYRNGSIDTNTLDLKTFYFTDANSRNEILLKAAGTGDIPEQKANFRADVDLFQILNLEYIFDWHTLKTDTNIGVTNGMTLYPASGAPLEYTTTYNDLFYYKNDYMTHSVVASVRPVKELLVSAAYRRTDGDMTNTFTRDAGPDPGFDIDYSRDVYEVRARYRFPFGSELSGAYIRQDIDQPVYRVAGEESNDYQISFYHPFTEKLSGQVSYRNADLKDDRIALDNQTQMLDASVQYQLMEEAFVGAGFTRFDLDYDQNFQYYYHDAPVVQLSNFSTVQNGVYAFANIDGTQRVKGHFSVYYLWDDGTSFPFSRWMGDATLEVGVTRQVSALFSARQFNYSEDMYAVHDYNVNEVRVALRWLIR